MNTKPETDIVDLRFGYAAPLFYQITGEKEPKQLDLLDTWFPGLIVKEMESDGTTKTDAEIHDHEFLIYAARYRGKLYTGTSSRVTQTAGRLIGTARGSRDKERKTAELFRKHLAEVLVTDSEALSLLQENTDRKIDILDQDQLNAFWDELFEFAYDLAETRSETDPYDLMNENAPMDDEVFDGVIYNTIYQLHLRTYEGTVNAFLWLLIGGLLRNETGRLLRMFDSSFRSLHKGYSEHIPLLQKLNILLFPEDYEPVYEGDDFESRFPDITWHCDCCGDTLNDQENFDDHLPYWQCRKCGYLNMISADEIYASEEDYYNGIKDSHSEMMEQAVETRKKEKDR